MDAIKLISKTKLPPSSNVILVLKQTALNFFYEFCIVLWIWDCPTPILGPPLSSILFYDIGAIEVCNYYYYIEFSSTSCQCRNCVLVSRSKIGLRLCMLCHVILLCCYASVFNDQFVFLCIALYSFSTDIIQQNKIITEHYITMTFIYALIGWK